MKLMIDDFWQMVIWMAVLVIITWASGMAFILVFGGLVDYD